MVIRSFPAIKNYQPEKLYIVCDGPRPSNDSDKNNIDQCVFYIKNNVDWKCNITWIISNENLGCGKRVSSGLSRVFSSEEFSLIIEDDCICSLDFFKFCEFIYRNKADFAKVAHISGSSFTGDLIRDLSSECGYYSKIAEMWGWATWAQHWKNYKFRLDQSDISNNAPKYKSAIHSWKFREKFQTLSLASGRGLIDTWDYQWMHFIFTSDLYAAVPSVSLVDNIGNGPDATHTKKLKNYSSFRGDVESFKIKSFGFSESLTKKMDFIHFSRRHGLRFRAAVRYYILRKLCFTNL
jgi:hypothetical protein